MMLKNKVILISYVFSFFIISCIHDKGDSRPWASEYDLENGLIVKLDDALAEISGIAFYPKDTSVFAISDEKGSLYKIHLTTQIPVIEKWKFSSKRDYEDLVLLDSTFYVLESNGNIHQINFTGEKDSLITKEYLYPGAKDEFESLYYDSTQRKLMLICKECKSDKKGFVSSWSWDPSNGKYQLSTLIIQTHEMKNVEEKNKRYKASAATLNPLTGELWLVSSINKMILISDKEGHIINQLPLNTDKIPQPEGITFTPWGDLILSSEAGDQYGVGSLYIFKKQKSN